MSVGGLGLSHVDLLHPSSSQNDMGRIGMLHAQAIPLHKEKVHLVLQGVTAKHVA